MPQTERQADRQEKLTIPIFFRQGLKKQQDCLN